MLRTLPVCALLVLAPVCWAGGAQDPTETVIKLSLQPAAAPRPALRYQLLPELREMSPGNAVPVYLKCFMQQNHFWFDKQVVEKREKWQSMPLGELPQELQGHQGYATGSGPLRF